MGGRATSRAWLLGQEGSRWTDVAHPPKSALKMKSFRIHTSTRLNKSIYIRDEMERN